MRGRVHSAYRNEGFWGQGRRAQLVEELPPGEELAGVMRLGLPPLGAEGNERARPCDSSPSLPNPSISRFLPVYPLPPLGYQCRTPASVIQRDKRMKTIFWSPPRMSRGAQEDEGK